MEDQIRSHRRALFELQYTLVVQFMYSTEIDEQVTKLIKEKSAELLLNKNSQLIGFGVYRSSIWLCFSGHPNLTLAVTVNNLKTILSRYLRSQFVVFKSEKQVWTNNYAIFTDHEKAIQFIQNQYEKS